jgi:pimeloyl-ACP methyl ester carboxylesterase
VLADYLTRKGVAVLRCDDRGVGKSTGKHDGATSADFATDAYAAVQYLKTRKDVNPKRIGLVGHSEGGLIGPMVAAEHPDDIAFVVMLAGPGLRGDELLVYQQAAILKASGVVSSDIAVHQRVQKAMLAAAKNGGDNKKLLEAVTKLYEEMSAEEKKIIGPEDEKPKEADFRRFASPWMTYFLNYDPRPTLQKVRCPLLAINGEFDLQVTPTENLPAIAAALKEGGNANATTKMLPGLNHLFQHTKTGSPSEYGTIEETFAPEALDVIAAWILQRK